MGRTSAGEITFPHFGHTASSDASTFSRLIFPRAWHGYDPALFTDCTARSTVGGFFAFSSGRPCGARIRRLFSVLFVSCGVSWFLISVQLLA
jgi:hypothetical protein